MEVAQLVRQIYDIANKIDRVWAKHGCDYYCFPDIVLEHTNDLDVTPLGLIQDVCCLLDDPAIAALQSTNSFSDLYVKLYDNGRFWVEILNWWNTDINIHDHDFAAVQFQARGRSLNVKYVFEEVESLEGVRFGNLMIEQSEIWKIGGRSVTLPGSPHTVKHLSTPTVSVLIRTHPEKRFGPQRNYFPPGVVASYGVADTVFRKKLKALRLLSAGPRSDFHAAFRSFIAAQTLSGALFAFVKTIDIIFDPEHVDLVRDFALQRGAAGEQVIEAVALYRFTDFLLKQLSVSQTLCDDETVLLAVLSCAFSFESFDQLAKQLYGPQYKMALARVFQEIASRLDGHGFRTVQNALDLCGLSGLLEGSVIPAPIIN